MSAADGPGARDRRPPLAPLPIDEHVERIAEALRVHGSLVLTAPPGSGKTTRLPPALLDAGLCSGRLLMLQPRRVAARAAAARIAEERGWTLGEQVGYRVRFERCSSPATRIEVVTEGILVRWLQDDPLLTGVDVVVLDEFHERSLSCDLALGMLREIRRTVREDLQLVVLSATLDAQPVAAYLDGAPRIAVEGRLYPVDVRYLERRDDRPLHQQLAAGVARALREGPADGDVLVFLPGAREIRRTREELARQGASCEVVVLHGSLPFAEQQRALRRGQSRRVVLSTNVAETSVTIEGIVAVVDSGLARIPRHEPRSGIDRLELNRISQASADQRAGRAGRLGPGVAYRLWSRAEQQSLPAHTVPEIRRVDLCRALLELRAWGSDPRAFGWLEPPAAGTIERGEQLLGALGALAPDTGWVTDLGRRMLRLPLHPRLSRLLVEAQRHGCRREGAALGALLSERDIVRVASKRSRRDLPSGPSDLLLRLELLHEAERARFSRAALRDSPVEPDAARRVARVRDDLLARMPPAASAVGGLPDADPAARDDPGGERALLQLVLAAYPDRVARRRSPGAARAVMVGGRGLVLGGDSVVRDAELFVAVVVDGAAGEARALQASAIDRSWLPTEQRLDVWFDERTRRVVGRQRSYYRDLCLDERPAPVDPARAAELLAGAAAERLAEALPRDGELGRWLARLRSAARWMPELDLPRFDDEQLRELLPELCVGCVGFDDLQRLPLQNLLEAHLTERQRRGLARAAPLRLALPSGRQAALRYRDDGPPVLAVKLQEMFGARQTPRVAEGRVAVLLHLLAPNRRPVQVTQDLDSFWSRTYIEVRKELRRRYPKHPWPEDPLSAKPTAATKRRR